MKKVKILFSVMALFACLIASAQNITVKGVVTDASTGEPLPGAAVLVKGTADGVTTDLGGNYSIVVPQDATLGFTTIGFKDAEIEVRGRSEINVALHPDAELLEDVVVVAYGTSKKSSFTGSASTVGSSKLELRPITNITNGIEGQTTGVLTTSSSGQPGSSSSIIIRGFGSIRASSSPLYVVDGIPFDGSISSINPNDIESITILKDASAGALYGARAANGVVMLTTKKGKEGRASISWRSTFGWASRAVKPYDMVDAKDYVQLSYEALRNSYLFTNGYSWADAEAQARADLSSTLGGEAYNPFKNYSWDNIIDPATGQVRPDAKAAWDEKWMDQLLRENAFRHEHQLSLNGGTERTKYMMSLGYLNEDGILVTTGFQRFNGRVNVSSQVTDWFSANLNASLSNSKQNFSDYDGSSVSNVWYSAQFVSPLFPLYIKDADGHSVLDENGKPQLDYGEGGRPGSYNDYNPLGGLLDDKSDIVNDNAGVRTGITLGGDSERLGVFQGLKFSANFGADYRTQNQMQYMNMYHGNQKNAGGLLEKYNSRMLSYTFNQLLTYNRTFGRSNIDFLAGHEFYSYNYKYLAAGKTNLVDGIYELRPGTTLYDADSYSQDYRIESWLGRINYTFDDKYYLSASLRTDGSSRFYKDNRWGTFWSVGANWRVSKESFMENISWIDNLSVKASYGQQGNDDLNTYYAWQSLYSLSYANENNIGAFVSSLENKTISWEKRGSFNAGIDASLFNSRLSFSVEYYNNKTYDMLLSYPMALSTGFSGYDANVGDMVNKGFEFNLNVAPISTRDFSWDITWMGTTTRNKVLHLTADSPEIISGIYSIKEGSPLNTFLMARSAGVDPATGAQLYWTYEKDDDGNMVPGTETITSDYSEASTHKYYLGTRIPDLYGSLGTNLRWKGLTLSVLTTYSIGGKVYDSLYAGSINNMYYNTNFNSHALRRWQKPGDVTDVPRIEVAGSYATNDRFLVDASYFNIKNITLGYYLPKPVVDAIRLNSVRVFASGDNLALFNHLDGMDPQHNFTGSTDYVYSPNRTFTLGFEINF